MRKAIRVEAGRIVIAPIRAQPRAAWAEDAKRLAEDGDDALVWPEFGNADDSALTWCTVHLRRREA